MYVHKDYADTLKKGMDVIDSNDIVIECFEPGLNKKVGNNWGDNEYFQTIDEEFEYQKFKRSYENMMANTFSKWINS